MKTIRNFIKSFFTPVVCPECHKNPVTILDMCEECFQREVREIHEEFRDSEKKLIKEALREVLQEERKLP